MSFSSLREKAIAFRRSGLSYSEILNQIPIAKSTLSTWLHSVGLSKKQKQRLTEKKLASAKRGALKKHEMRLLKTDAIFKEAIKDITHISKRELFLIGIALYWAEGSKEKEHDPGSGIQFSNSDPAMIKIFIHWLTDICVLPRERIGFSIYIHENHRYNLRPVIAFWSKQTRFPQSAFKQIYFKRHNPKTTRKNTKDLYHGLLRVRVSRSSDLNRKISGWIKAINNQIGG